MEVKFTIHEIDQRSDDWTKLRLGRVGSSEIHALTSSTQRDTLAYKKASEIKLGSSPFENYTNSFMEEGIEYEDQARSFYEIKSGNDVKQVGYVSINEYTGASPDGLVGEDGLVEIKCQQPHVYLKSKHTKKITISYVSQMQWQMYCTNRSWCDFVVYSHHFDEIFVQKVNRDEDHINKLLDAYKKYEIKLKKILEI